MAKKQEKPTKKASSASKARKKPVAPASKDTQETSTPKKFEPKQIALPANIHKGHIECVKTARHYAFTPFEFEVEKQDITKSKSIKDKSIKLDGDSVLTFEHFLEEKVALIRNYAEKKMQDLPQPPTICYSGPLKGSLLNGKTKEHIFNIDSLNNPKSIADAVVIETAYVILKEHHDIEELMIEINSVGDKESFSRFTKEFIQYYKKRLPDLPVELRNIFKKDPLCLASTTHDALEVFAEEAPKPIDFLSEENRTHFREVLEFLESLGLPYMINHSLIGSRNCSTGTVFQIIGVEEKPKGEKRTTLAIGERYNSVSRKALGKKEIPAVGAHILVDDKDIKKADTFILEEEIKFYFIHLGYDAKLKSLSILELLRTAKIPVHQALSKDKITVQLQAAEKLAVPYILLVGQKEAIENSVTVRHVETRIQETIHIDNLIEYLKKLC
jgi:histidyl-tRNA synthetase